MSQSRLPRVRRCRAALALVLAGVSSGCGGTDTSAPEQLWVADNYVQCNDFDEPLRHCLLVSHDQHGLYRHLEGAILGFDYQEGTKYLLEVEPIDDPRPGREAPYRLIEVLSTE